MTLIVINTILEKGKIAKCPILLKTQSKKQNLFLAKNPNILE